MDTEARSTGSRVPRLEGTEMRNEWCFDCLEEFRYDDTGGYNPPCQCKFKCRSCCESECEDDPRQDHDVDDFSPSPTAGEK